MTILFADLVGFTTFAEGRDAEDTRELLSRYFDLAGDVIGRYGGAVEKFIGDAVMAVWGAPTAHEDDAERAVRAGLDLVDAVTTLGPVDPRAGGSPDRGGRGHDRGHEPGDGRRRPREHRLASPVGRRPGHRPRRRGNRASRKPGDRRSSLPANRRSRARPRPCPPGGPFGWSPSAAVDGGPKRSRPRSSAATTSCASSRTCSTPPARDRRARLVSVIGPAGIGKSRLAWEFLKYLDGLVETVRYHDGRSPAYGEGISFWALGEMVRRRAGLLETDDESTTRAKIAATLAKHVPDQAERRWIEPALLALLGIESGVGPEQLFGAWRTFFERMAASAPVVMVFEDHHYADPGLLDFVDHLLEWSRNVPIYVVTLSRPELARAGALTGAPGSATSPRSTSSRCRSRPCAHCSRGSCPGCRSPRSARSSPARTGSRSTRSRRSGCSSPTEGSPSKTGPTVRSGTWPTLAVPETLTALIASRLDGLVPDDRALVSDAAVLGQSFTLAGLAAVSGLAEPELEPRLRAFVRRELLTLETDPRSPERGQYAFVQALIREVAYNTLAKPDRKRRHLAAARFFESLGTDELAGGLAGHYLAAHANAAEGPEADALATQARIALVAAADRAAALGSHEQAVVFLRQALTVTTDPAEEAELLERAGESASAASHHDEAEALSAPGGCPPPRARRSSARPRGPPPPSDGRSSRSTGRRRRWRSSSPPRTSSPTWTRIRASSRSSASWHVGTC